jgi:hypothetical protein
MPTFLSDPSTSVYLLLGTAAIVAGAVWLSGRSRKALVATAVCGLLLGLVYLIDFLVESPREQAVRKMRELALATQTNDSPGITRHFAEQFRYGSTTKKQVAEQIQRVKGRFPGWNGGAVWGFDRESFEQLSETQLKIGFSGQAKDFPQTQHYLVATYQKEPDGEWRILKVAFYDAMQGERGGEKKIAELGQ